jgi:preprotein translocase subunit SecD
MALGGTMIGTGHHSPQLAIDLAGGTSLTMKADKTPSAQNMDTAVSIMRNRVNGFGVSEAEVSKQGSNEIQIDLPGSNSSALIQQVSQTAQLYFRQVYPQAIRQMGATPTPNPSSTPTTGGTPSSTPSSGSTSKPPSTPSASSPTSTTAKPSPSASSTQHRVVDQGLLAATPGTSPSANAAAASSGTAPTTPSASKSGATPAPSPTPPTPASNGQTRQTQPDAATIALFEKIDCRPGHLSAADATAIQSAPVQNFAVGCSLDGNLAYMLEPADVNGTDITSASARQGQTSTGIVTGTWEVDLSLKDPGKKEFGIITGQLASSGGQFAVVVDGLVYSAPTASQAIVDGNAQITGNFTQKTATDLANILSYGALPVKFTAGDVQQVSASLGGNQLAAGLLAGAIGLGLVVLYLIFYYKGLSFVAVSSLVISAMLTYAIATLLGPGIGFRLSLAGVAGLVVAIGITADSFVVFFERLRDEVRDGRTLRTAVDHGWTRARRTIIAADFVSFLAAAVLYVVSVGTVKGFAFTLGLTTVIDIVVVFMFTKPVMTLLARQRFFSDGHKWSGLDPNRLGAKRAASGPRQTIADRRRAAEAEGMEA